MKKFHPIVIKEYAPLTELEMKNVFGGSGESGESGLQVCRTENAMCTKTFTYTPLDPNKPVESDKATGKCVTITGTSNGDSGYFCTCSSDAIANPNYSGTVSISHDCKII